VIVQAARRVGSTENMAAACNFPSVPANYGFGAIEAYNIVNSVRVSKKHRGIRIGSQSRGRILIRFHHASRIRHGALYYNANDLANARVPIRHWINGGPDYQPPQQANAQNSALMGMNERPSNLDIAALKTIYRW
jgi:hypothetical protein